MHICCLKCCFSKSFFPKDEMWIIVSLKTFTYIIMNLDLSIIYIQYYSTRSKKNFPLFTVFVGFFIVFIFTGLIFHLPGGSNIKSTLEKKVKSSADRLIRSGIKKFHKLLEARGVSQKRSEGLNWDHFKHPLGKGSIGRIPPPPGSTEILT